MTKLETIELTYAAAKAVRRDAELVEGRRRLDLLDRADRLEKQAIAEFDRYAGVSPTAAPVTRSEAMSDDDPWKLIEEADEAVKLLRREAESNPGRRAELLARADAIEAKSERLLGQVVKPDKGVAR